MTFSNRPDARLPVSRAGKDPQLLRLLGEASLGKGEARAATMLFRRAVRLAPELSQLKASLGGAYFAAGQYERAAVALNASLREAPSEADAHGNVGTMLRLMGRRAESVAQHRRAVALRPGSAEAHTDLADALSELGEIGDAINAYQRALALKPDSIVAHMHLGKALSQVGRLTEAVAVFQRARTLKPSFTAAYVDLGKSLVALGETRSAVAQFDQAIARDPDDAEAHWCRAQVRLLTGDLEAAWDDYLWRRQADPKPTSQPALPLWDGTDLGAGTLLVTEAPTPAETILLARYLPRAAALCGRLVVQAPAGLLPLLGRIPGIEVAAAATQADATLPMSLLPHRFGIDLATVGTAVPYLTIDPPETPPASATVLLALAPDRLAPGLFPREAMLGLGRFLKRCSLRTVDATQTSTEEVARRIVASELVVAADPFVANLAGALGHPTWVLLCQAPDWWWHLGRDDSPWYPSARLFRQAGPGTWENVFGAVATGLSERF